MVPEPTVFLVDDDPMIVAALKDLVEMLGLSCSCFHSAAEFLEAYRPTAPGCLVLDVRMPGMSGLELQKELIARGIDLPTIIVTGFADVRIAVEAMKAGAIEFLEKPFRTQELCDHIQKAIKLAVVKWEHHQQRAEVERHLSSLTRAEKQVLGLIVAGKTNRLMAAELDLSVRTIEDRRARLMHKLGVRSRAELIELVTTNGVAPDDESAKNPPE
ncbi:MAG: response regulator transcription factor [Thermoguttaceae bacterium]